MIEYIVAQVHDNTFAERRIVGSGNIMSWVLSTRSSYHLIDITNDPRYNHEYDGPCGPDHHHQTEAARIISSMFYVPLNDPDQDQTIGILHVIRYQSRPPLLAEHCQYIELIADMIMRISIRWHQQISNRPSGQCFIFDL